MLAITDGIEYLDLIDFKEKDLIDLEDDKDLIDFETEIPNLIEIPKRPTAQEILIDEKLFPKGKKYKVLQDEDVIPTTCWNYIFILKYYPIH